MATYQELHGRPVKSTTADLSGTAAEGQIWYNSTTNVLKVMYPFTGWSTVASTVTGVTDSGGCGTTTAALYAFGLPAASVWGGTYTEEYDGTCWARQTGTLNQRRTSGCMFGTQESALVFGGRINDGNPGPTYSTIATEEWDGTSWAAGGNYPLIITTQGGAGTQTAGLGATGYTTPSDPGTDTPVSAEYNGTSWTAGNPVITARRDVNKGPAGTQTAALLIDGRVSTTHQTACEEYDGTSWATAGSTTVTMRGSMCFGIQTSALAGFGHQGGQGNYSAASQTYDGTSWTGGATGNWAREMAVGSGATNTSGLAIGGASPPGPITPGATEEYSTTGTVVKTITTS